MRSARLAPLAHRLELVVIRVPPEVLAREDAEHESADVYLACSVHVLARRS